MANPEVVVEFLADTSRLKSGVSQASSSARGFGTTLKTLGKTGALAAGAAGVGALVTTLKVGWGEFQQSQKVMAQTEAVLKSTGHAAGVTAKDVAGLAEATMKKTGIDDEAIQSGENMLLTFTNIHNEVGKGNDIFKQATAAVTDMDSAMTKGNSTQESLSKTAIQVGKALQDPIKGATALRRVGVQLTEAQQEQIKGMVESGHTMQAQKVILGELTKEFGGTAEAIGGTVPGQLKILRESFNNLAGDLVGKLVPYVQLAITWLRDHWPEISAAFQQAWAAIKPTLDGLVQLIGAVVSVVRDNWSTIGPVVTQVADIFAAQFKIIGAALQLVAALLRGDWSEAWTQAKNLVLGVVDEIEAQVVARLLIMKAALDLLWQGVQLAATAAWDAVKTEILGVVTAVETAVTTGMNAVKTVVTTTMTAIQTAVTTAWNAIKTAVTTTVTAIQTAVTTAWNAIKTAVTTAVTTTQTAVTTAWNAIKTAVTTAIGPITTAVTDLAHLFEKPATAAETMLGAIKTAVGAIAGAITAVIGAVGRAASKLADAMLAPINAAKGAINAVLSKFNALQIPAIPGFSVPMPGPIPDIHFGGAGPWSLPDIPLLAKGGIVTGPTLAMIGESGPEMVLPLGSTGAPIDVRVFIGNQELRDLVRVEIVRSDDRIARTLLAGATA